MQLDAQRYLKLVEKANTIGFLDIESQGREADYGGVHVISVAPLRGKPKTWYARRLGADRRMVKEARDWLNELDLWVTFYGKGFDVSFLNTRLLRWNLEPLQKRHHLDLYYLLRWSTRTGRHSQAHLISWLKLKEPKMSVSADDWTKPIESMATLVKRCESDVRGLKSLYERTKHLVGELTR
jgi:hypothetical protein